MVDGSWLMPGGMVDGCLPVRSMVVRTRAAAVNTAGDNSRRRRAEEHLRQWSLEGNTFLSIPELYTG